LTRRSRAVMGMEATHSLWPLLGGYLEIGAALL
jgi:hypothetical protein